MAVFRVPWSTESDTTFEYQGRKVVIGKVLFNKVMERMSTSITVDDRTFSGVVITSGVDLLNRFSTGLPPLYAFNTQISIADPNMTNLILIFDEVANES